MDDATARRATSFGAVADLYDRSRPGYPAAVIDDVVAAVPGACDLVEVGCGTGKATTMFAASGLKVIGVEPDESMASVARHNLRNFPNATLAVASFERWHGAPRSADIVAAAQSWHWIDPQVAFSKAKALLRTPGALAIFANTPRPEHTDRHDEIDAVYRKVAPGLATTSVMTRWKGRYDEAEYWRHAMEVAGFNSPEIRAYDWTHTYSTEQYITLLRTHSDHRMLPTADLGALLDGISSVIERHGGRFDFAYRTVLVLALRR